MTGAGRVPAIDRRTVTAAAFGIAAAVLYLIVGDQGSGTDVFLPLASSFLQGHLWVEPRTWIELVPLDGHWYAPFPPAPALFYLPIAAVAGPQTWDQELPAGVMPAILGGVAVAIAYLLVRRQCAEEPARWITLGFATTTLFWVAGTAGTHLMAEVSATVFLLGSLWFALERRRPIIAGVLFGLAVASRLPVGMAIPLFIYLYRGATWRFLVGAVPIGALVGLYNLARFGSVIDFGYARIPASDTESGLVTGEPWYTEGIMSPTYLSRGFDAMLLAMPRLDLQQAPFIRPSMSANSLLIAAPFLFWSLLARGRLALAVGISAALVILVDWMHGNTGTLQFGYRFVLDATPLLLVLLAIAMPVRTSIWFRAAVIVGAVATAYAFWAYSVGFID